MRVFRLVSYPATLMLLAAAVYTIVRVVPSERMGVFTMLGMTAVGATELVHVAVRLIARAKFNDDVTASLVTGVGALLVGFSLLDGWATIPFVIGSLLFGSGMLIRTRARGTQVG